MTAGAIAVLLAAAAGLVGVGGRPGLQRLARVAEARGPATQAAPPPVVPRWLRRRPTQVVGIAAGVALVAGHGAIAVLLGVLAASAGARAARGQRAERAAAEAVARDLPRAAELLATCLEAGASPAAAVEVVAEAVPGPVGRRLREVAALLRSGAELLPARAVTGSDPVDRLVRAVARSGATGAPLARTVREAAADERARQRAALEERARAVGVRAVGPLAVCFLPAFVLVGVVPVVVGIARGVLGVTA